MAAPASASAVGKTSSEITGRSYVRPAANLPGQLTTNESGKGSSLPGSLLPQPVESHAGGRAVGE
jgi:hypothetical protein